MNEFSHELTTAVAITENVKPIGHLYYGRFMVTLGTLLVGQASL